MRRLAKFPELLLNEAVLSFVFRQARIAALFEKASSRAKCANA